MITPDDITDEMVKRFSEVADFVYEEKPIIAAAVNAYLPQDDAEKITAEWMGALEQYRKDPHCECYYFGDSEISGTVWLDDLSAFDRPDEWKLRCAVVKGRSNRLLDVSATVETRGQLRAWHKFAGQELEEGK